MLHLINLDAEIYSASQYLPHLYEQQRNVLCKILNEKHQSECAIEQQRKQLSAQINGVQKELDALLTKELTVQISAQEVGITIPDHPNEPQKPVYKTPGLFNKKATLKYNEDLQIQYEQKMQAYHIELERFKAALDVELSLRLENAFRLFSASFEGRRNDFSERPTATIREGIEYLCSSAIIDNKDCAMMCETYDFGEAPLSKLLTDENHLLAFQDLLRQLCYLAEKGSEQ